MRRVTTWLLVAAVVVVGAVAVADALRGDPEAPPGTASPVTTADNMLTTTLAPPVEGGLGGVLYYTDESCRLRGVELPSLRAAEVPAWAGCEFSLAPSGRGIQSEAAVWDPAGVAWAIESGPNVVVFSAPSSSVTLRGSAPAFRPDGTFTYVRDDSVRALRGDCGRTSTSAIVLPARAALACSRVLVAPEELRRSLELPSENPRIRQMAWLSDTRLVALVEVDRLQAHGELIAVVEDGRVVRTIGGEGAGLGRLWTSPGGRFFAVEARTLLLFDRDGNPEPGPPVGRVRSVAWAPDESWAAVATAQDVHLFLTGTADLRLRRLHIVARDLAWRGPGGPPRLEASEEARAWLAGVGVTGRLFVTDAGCRLGALRLPDLAWEETPGAVRAPCRFGLGPDDRPLAENVAVDPRSGSSAVCDGGSIRVFGPDGPVATVPRACAPAWTPDGRLTFIRDGELLFVEPGSRERLLISREDLESAFGRDATLEEAAWIDDERLWVAARSGGSAVLAAMTESRLLFSPTFTAQRIEGLRVNATGMVAARADEAVVFFDTGGRRALSFPGARAVAWAPGELVAAVALPHEILFVAPVSREVVAVPLAVSDLEWVVR